MNSATTARATCAGFILFGVFASGSSILLAESEAEFAARAAALHARIFTIDTHLDTPTLSLRRPGWDIAQRHDPLTDVSQVDFPRMRAGGLKAGVFAVFVEQKDRTPAGYAQVRDNALRSFLRIHAIAARHPGECELALTAADGDRIAAAGKRALYLSIENGYAIGRDLTLLKTYRELGARFFGLVHSKHNDLADSSGEAGPEHGGVSSFGREAIAECNRLGMVLDASHASDEATHQMITLSQTPIMLTHSGCRAVWNSRRNIDDGLLRALAAKGGVIQIVADTSMVKTPNNPEAVAARAKLMVRAANTDDDAERAEIEREWFRQRRALLKVRATLDDFMQHVFHVVDTVGVDHVGIGADFDGGGGVVGMEDVSDYPKITYALLKRGLSEADVEKIWGGNTLRVLRAAEENAKQHRAVSKPATRQTLMEEFMIPAADPGIGRSTRPREMSEPPSRIRRSCARRPRSRTSAPRWISSVNDAAWRRSI